MNITDIKYDVCKNWIKDQRERLGKDWDLILSAKRNNISELKAFLNSKAEDDGWPTFYIDDRSDNNGLVSEDDLYVNEWRDLVLFMKNAEEMTDRILFLQGQATILSSEQDQKSGVYCPTGTDSAWQCYLNRLHENGFPQESIDAISHATLNVLRQLSADTRNTEARKGLVIGNVQSGKTANMAALMAMAADWGYNMFIVLSGTLESLREQTQNRLYKDLNNEGSKFNWLPLEHLKRNSPIGYRSQDLDFSDVSFQRYFTVSLKNSTRLKNLIQWLLSDVNSQEKMKIIVIDDEADQAGINTADVRTDERKTINRLITNMVNGKTVSDKNALGKYKAMNYIGYTATPYANVLNDANIESLYPKDFISTLAVSKEYFGPQQIFGYDGNSCYFEGLDIIREVGLDETDEINSIHAGNSTLIPNSLRDAICWFFSGVACLRLWQYKKPISMLVHTSQRIPHHSKIANAISSWIINTPESVIINLCKQKWEEESVRFSKQLFREQYKEYARDDKQIKDYPPFKDIFPELKTLLSEERLSFIQLGDDNERIYNKHIHLCIDNCAQKNAYDDDYVRLAYPTSSQLQELGYAPAFIVVGGATLSRGLTIEGLISTYFLRSVGQADTLMQMGRWFGYRKGYELIPRIWMTQKTRNQFKFLAELDQELRDEIHSMEVRGQSPRDYGVRVKNSPKVSFIKITAANRMQSAETATWEFGGCMKQTYMFDNDSKILKDNLDLTRVFLEQLGHPIKHKACNTHACHTVLWQSVPFEGPIEGFLKAFKYQQRLGVFNDIEPLIQWIKDASNRNSLNNWSVILAGTDNPNRDIWKVSELIKVRKIIRNQKKTDKIEGVLNIGTLRTATDSLADIDLENADNELKNRMIHPVSKDVNDIRYLAGMDKVPQLLIYIVDKNSKVKQPSPNREDLNAVEDVVGICINLPGESRTNNTGTVAIDVRKYFNTTFDGDIDDKEE